MSNVSNEIELTKLTVYQLSNNTNNSEKRGLLVVLCGYWLKLRGFLPHILVLEPYSTQLKCDLTN